MICNPFKLPRTRPLTTISGPSRTVRLFAPGDTRSTITDSCPGALTPNQ